MATIYVNPTAKAGGNGSSSSPYNSWSSVKFSAGNTYLQAAGTTYTGTLTIGVQGSAAHPITIGSYGGTAQPIIKGVVNFSGAAYATLQGFSVTGSTSAGVLIQNSGHITLNSDVITKDQMGVWIGSGGSSADTITGCTIVNNTTIGIAVDDIGSASAQSSITNNTVSWNGTDGIQLDGNYFTVSGNTTQGNGDATQGAAGIHVYTGSATEGYGQHNTIQNNISIGNYDLTGPDGEGIDLDQWTSGNTVSGNLFYDNEGAGIMIFDSAKNTITDNVLFDNELNPGNSHPDAGEIVLSQALGLTANNKISSNEFLGVDASAVYVDAVSAGDANTFQSDILENMAGGSIYDWAGTSGTSLSFWQGVAGSSNTFTGASVTNPSGITASFLFPTGMVEPINGVSTSLYGWSPTYGLLGTA